MGFVLDDKIIMPDLYFIREQSEIDKDLPNTDQKSYATQIDSSKPDDVNFLKFINLKIFFLVSN